VVTYSVPGQIQVYGWDTYRIKVGNVILDTVVSFDAKRTNHKTTGTSTIFVADEYGELYDDIGFLDEIEIYIQDPDNFFVPNKVWGGWLEDRIYAQGNDHVLRITGKEYSSALFDKNFTRSYATSTDIATISNDIVTDDGTLSTEDLPASTTKFLSLDFDKERHWDALDRITESTGYEFGVSLEQKVYLRDKDNAPLSPDTITLGDNMIVTQQTSSGKDIATDITVQGSTSGVSSNVVNSDAESAYGRKRELYTVFQQGENTTTTQETANSIRDKQSTELKKFQIDTAFLPYTEPNDLITVTVEGTELEDDYKVLEIEWRLQNNANITSRVTLNQTEASDTDVLSNLAKRYNTAEKKVYA